jgi:Methionine biosynthesis protein MetW
MGQDTSSTSIIYRSRFLYEAVMLALYRGEYSKRSRAIAAVIPDGATVVDLCCGPASLYFRHLCHKRVTYTGLDINRNFVARLSARGVSARFWDAATNAPLPKADYLVMQSSLYHFLPDPYPVVDRMLAAASKLVVLTEPVRNLADSKNRLVAWLAKRLSDPGTGDQPHRFDEALFQEFLNHYQRLGRVVDCYPIAGGREQLCLLRA